MTDQKTGLKSLGFIANFDSYLDNLQNLLVDTEQTADSRKLDQAMEDQKESNLLKFLNKFGYENDRDGSKLTFEKARYVRFDTTYTTRSKEIIFGWFYRIRPDQNYTGVYFGTEKDFDEDVADKAIFRMGDLSFDNWNDAYKFLEDIADNTIPEVWTYHEHKSGIPHPILKSYIENLFEKLKREEGKILLNKDEIHAIFNSNLLDKYFHEIFIVAEYSKENDKAKYSNPFRLKSTSDLIRLNFENDRGQIKKEDDLPNKAKFFTDINQVIFQTNWIIDRSFEKFKHIIEDRKDRFPSDYQTNRIDQLARSLDNAIGYAVAIAERNYKFIVPQYRPQDDKIQLLMPIYLGGSFTEKPDFALILDPDYENQIYIPQTILPLDAAYQNARLIAKPDDYWLNPEKI